MEPLILSYFNFPSWISSISKHRLFGLLFELVEFSLSLKCPWHPSMEVALVPIPGSCWETVKKKKGSTFKKGSPCFSRHLNLSLKGRCTNYPTWGCKLVTSIYTVSCSLICNRKIRALSWISQPPVQFIFLQTSLASTRKVGGREEAVQLPGKVWLYYFRSSLSHSLVFLWPLPDATEKDIKASISCVNLIRLLVNRNCPRTWSIEFSIISVNSTYSEISGFSQSALTHPAQMDLAEVLLSVVCWNKGVSFRACFYLAMI